MVPDFFTIAVRVSLFQSTWHPQFSMVTLSGTRVLLFWSMNGDPVEFVKAIFLPSRETDTPAVSANDNAVVDRIMQKQRNMQNPFFFIMFLLVIIALSEGFSLYCNANSGSCRGIEERLEKKIRELLLTKEYLEFLVGRDGEFDQLVASTVRRCKRAIRDDIAHLLL